MNAIRTPESNTTFTLPDAGHDRDLPAQRFMAYDPDLGQTEADAKPAHLTLWMPTEAEAARLEAGAAVELIVHGDQHPPVSVGVTSAVLPEAERIDRGHVDRALGLLYAKLQERIVAAGNQLAHEGLDYAGAPNGHPIEPVWAQDLVAKEQLEALEVSLEQVGANVLGLPDPETFVELWATCVDSTRPADAGGPRSTVESDADPLLTRGIASTERAIDSLIADGDLSPEDAATMRDDVASLGPDPLPRPERRCLPDDCPPTGSCPNPDDCYAEGGCTLGYTTTAPVPTNARHCPACARLLTDAGTTPTEGQVYESDCPHLGGVARPASWIRTNLGPFS
ncbi:MAG: hypothetical protein WKF96_00255 [Solirubrobacteraceae bacterium]